MRDRSLIMRVTGYVSSLILTGVAFLIIANPSNFRLTNEAAVLTILALAVVQGVVQSICFLHVLSEKGPRWNLLVFASTVSVLLIIIVFSIWIMGHLDYNMMPMMHHH